MDIRQRTTPNQRVRREFVLNHMLDVGIIELSPTPLPQNPSSSVEDGEVRVPSCNAVPDMPQEKYVSPNNANDKQQTNGFIGS